MYTICAWLDNSCTWYMYSVALAITNDVKEIPTVIIAFQSVTDIQRIVRLYCRIRCLVLRHLAINVNNILHVRNLAIFRPIYVLCNLTLQLPNPSLSLNVYMQQES